MSVVKTGSGDFNKMTRSVFTFLFVIILIPGFCQLHNYNIEKGFWYPGNLTSTDGTKLAGEINFNFITGEVNIKNSGGHKVFIAKRVIDFQLRVGETVRSFYSLPFRDPNYRMDVKAFYEVIYSNDRLAILSKHEMEYKKIRQHGGNAGFYSSLGPSFMIPTPSGHYEVEKVFEKIYLADKKGNILFYASKKKDRDMHFSFDETSLLSVFNQDLASAPIDEDAKSNAERIDDLRYKIKGKSALSELTGVKYFKIEEFIKSRNLKVNTLDEIKQVIDYYESLF